MSESIVFCSTCTMSSLKKFTFAISSADDLLVIFVNKIRLPYFRLIMIVTGHLFI